MGNCQCMDKKRYPEYWRVCPYATRPPSAQAIEAVTGETRQRLDGDSHESAVHAPNSTKSVS